MSDYSVSSSEDESQLISAIEDESRLSSAIGALDKKEAEIRLGLRSRGGHRGKVDSKVLVWLEEFEKIKNQNSDLTKPSRIKKLPSSLFALSRLRVLFLQYCTSLRKIPSLKKLRDLRVLNLRGTLITKLPHEMEDLVSLRSLDLSETIRLKYIRTGVLSSLLNLEELQMQGSGLCKMQSETVRKCFKEIRCLKKLGILSLSAVGFEDHLDTILFLQGYSLKRFSINVYGSSSDYVDDV